MYNTYNYIDNALKLTTLLVVRKTSIFNINVFMQMILVYTIRSLLN